MQLTEMCFSFGIVIMAIVSCGIWALPKHITSHSFQILQCVWTWPEATLMMARWCGCGNAMAYQSSNGSSIWVPGGFSMLQTGVNVWICLWDWLRMATGCSYGRATDLTLSSGVGTMTARVYITKLCQKNASMCQTVTKQMGINWRFGNAKMVRRTNNGKWKAFGPPRTFRGWFLREGWRRSSLTQRIVA